MVGLTTVIAGFGAVIASYGAVRYAGGVETTVLEAHERCERAWGNVEVLLERRHDEVGTLIDVAAEHVDHERAVIQTLVDARERAIEAQHPPEAADASIEIREALSELDTVVSEVPELQSAERFADLRNSVTEIERRLETRREYYNEAVAAYNVRIARFPERFVAARHGLEPREPYQASAAAHDAPNVRERFDNAVRTDRSVDPDTGTNGGHSAPD